MTRREFLQYSGGASLAFLPSGLAFPFSLPALGQELSQLPDAFQLQPQYRVKRGIEAILRKVPAGFDAFITERYQDQLAAALGHWSSQLLHSPQDMTPLARIMSPDFSGVPLNSGQLHPVGATSPFEVWRVEYPRDVRLAKEPFLSGLAAFFSPFSALRTAELQIVRIHGESLSSSGESKQLATTVRFEIVGAGPGFHREQRVGHWELLWERNPSGEWRLARWQPLDEVRSRTAVPVFRDITAQAFGRNPSFRSQLIPGADYWRTVLDGATGIDIYGHHGVSVADIDGDGLDDLYVCQPAGLPNRLFHNRGDGTFEDITESAGVGVLENTACALFADTNNNGRQDLIVVRASGPLLFLNQGDGKFRLKPDAFQFANPPQGTFTGAAMADYDRDGWLDIYFCLYAYYQGADQYRYPMPYFDAENGPPNFLMRNNRDGTFRDVTKQSGLDRNNSRFSFCCAWSDYDGDLWPDLYVVNDFGRKNLYKNQGDGTFIDVAREAGVENVGAGMSGAWVDFDNDGRMDLYVADMWTAAGLRVTAQDNFQQDAGSQARNFYKMHAMGNSLF
ncbi:MAG TPA: VCBS repeat-containing protein, partial [Candidatus Acidoferrum sp.]